MHRYSEECARAKKVDKIISQAVLTQVVNLYFSYKGAKLDKLDNVLTKQVLTRMLRFLIRLISY